MVKAKDGAEVAEIKEPTDADLELNKETVKSLTADLRGIDFIPDSWDDIAAAFDGELVVFEGSPYKSVTKASLVSVPFVITDVRFYWSSKYDSPVVAVCALTQDNERIVFNDGSVGVFEQVRHMVQTTGRKAGVMCPNGLRASDYKVEVIDGMTDEVKSIEATTYYVA